MSGKKLIAFLCVLALMLALFAGCAAQETGTAPESSQSEAAPQTSGSEGAGEQTAEPQTQEPTAPNEAEESEETPAETEPAVETIHYAKGKYETDAEGWPLSYYVYETPICEEEITLSFWTACYTPEYMPEGGYNDTDYHQKEAELTGVNIEFIVPAWTNRAENYAVLRASDDLPDMMAQVGLYLTGTKTEEIEDGAFINIYDYKEYCPNYMYYIRSHMEEEFDVYTSVFLDNSTIFEFKEMYNRSLPSAALMGIRRDWVQKLGKETTDIVTVEDFHQLLLAFQTEFGCEHPLWMSNSVDGSNWFACYDTYTYVDNVNAAMYPNPCVIDGKVRFSYSDENAKAFVEMMSGWISEGLVSPDWMGDSVGVYWDDCFNGRVATTALVPQTITMLTSGTQEYDPDADWWYLPRSVLYPGQVLHLGNSASYSNNYNAGTAISGSCAYPELAVTWCDWRYSEEGSFLGSYGIEGTTWEWGEDGQPIATEEVSANTWLTMIYAMNFQVEHGLKIAESQYNYYPGSVEACMSVYEDFQSFAYDGAYEWPKGAILSADQSNEYMPYATDLSTYVQENILLFLNGDIPLTEWDNYVATLESIGLREGEAIYQEAYDGYVAKYA